MISTYRRRDILTGVASSAVMLAGCSGTGPDADGGQGSDGEAGTDAPPDEDTATPDDTPDDPATDTPDAGENGGGQYTEFFDGTYFDVAPSDDNPREFTADVNGWPGAYHSNVANTVKDDAIRSGAWDGTAELQTGNGTTGSVLIPGYHTDDWVVPMLYDPDTFDGRPQLKITTLAAEHGSNWSEAEVQYKGPLKASHVQQAGDTPFNVAAIDLSDLGWEEDDASGLLSISPDDQQTYISVRYNVDL